MAKSDSSPRLRYLARLFLLKSSGVVPKDNSLGCTTCLHMEMQFESVITPRTRAMHLWHGIYKNVFGNDLPSSDTWLANASSLEWPEDPACIMCPVSA